MKCAQCGKELKEGEVFTAVGISICKECNTSNDGTISMDLVMNKILGEQKNV